MAITEIKSGHDFGVKLGVFKDADPFKHIGVAIGMGTQDGHKPTYLLKLSRGKKEVYYKGFDLPTFVATSYSHKTPLAQKSRGIIEGVRCLRHFYTLFVFLKEIYMLESRFQQNLIKELKNRFDGCVVLKNDSSYIQGIPDLLVLFGSRWAMLECKASPNAKMQPNQEYYLDVLSHMSFAAMICPENKEFILAELEHAFRARR